MTEIALNAVLALLIPLFLKAAGDDVALARNAALQMLESYGAVTDAEQILAAETIALGFATVDNLARSLADPAMGITTRLRLRANANVLSRSADRNRQALARSKAAPAPANPIPSRQDPAETAPVAVQPAALPSAMQKVRDAIVEAAPALAEQLANVTQTMSRQQRRFLMRKAEQGRAAQEKEARKTARLAERAAQIAHSP